MLLNYYTEKGSYEDHETHKSVKPKGERRIKVNDRTATGGWF